VTRRLLAAASLLLLAAALVLTVVVAVDTFPRGVTVLACLVVAVLVAWWGLLRQGAARLFAFTAAALLLVGAVLFVVLEGSLLLDALIVAAFVLALAAARRAFFSHLELPPAARPQHAVLFYNPKSGGGKAERFHLADEARARGIEPVELKRGDDLRDLVRQAVEGGADALAAAGGDGTQAIVAEAAAERGLPYACIPAGTRNHFALDLGVDRDDVVGALDAFVNGGERVVDLAEVNGRVFVNNVSLGVYAQAVQSEGYRDAKLQTLMDTAPQVLGPDGDRLDIQWSGPDGVDHETCAVLLVSNDPYRLGRALASGMRPALDRGLLGIAVAGSASGGGTVRMNVQDWASESFEVRSGAPVAAGIDGEAVMLEPPLVFRSRPAALRVRIAPQHPGASPAAAIPASPWGGVRELARIAAGRSVLS
jgi:diacylglycerol kinase family enzyme